MIVYLLLSLAGAVRPPMVNEGSVDIGTIVEHTPLVINNELYRFESVHAAYHGSLTPGKNYMRFVHVDSGFVSPPFGQGYALGSAFAWNGTVYAYGTYCGSADSCGAATSNHEIRVFWSSDDMQTWQSQTALNTTGVLEGETAWNTSADRGVVNGTECFIMAFENQDPKTPGGWNTLFAVASNPAGPWTALDPQKFRMPQNVEHANPALRFIADERVSGAASTGWWYCITARLNSHDTPCTDSANRFFTEIYRSRNLIEWIAATGMGTPGAVDGMLKPNAAADRRPAGALLARSSHRRQRSTWSTTRMKRTPGSIAMPVALIYARSMGPRSFFGHGAIRVQTAGWQEA
jgi:hypothetical protein